MAIVYVIGAKGKVKATPFECTSADTEPEVITSDEEISSINTVSDSDKTESTEVATDTGNQGQ